jgi:hypothetical protein
MALHRSYLHIDKGVELFLHDGRSFFFYFADGDRQRLLLYLTRKCRGAIQTTNSAKFFAQSGWTEAWLSHRMSTFEYLMRVNFAAGRSFNDLSQYPIFPWILSDYTSKTIDLDDPSVYRNLGLPLGALNSDRLDKLETELRELGAEPGTRDYALFRVPCSSAYYTLYYMIRLEPFSTLGISIQDNRFDNPARLHTGIGRSWGVVTSTTNDFRELIPEYVCLPDFLENRDNFDLGLEKSDVELPPWAKGPVDFIWKQRRALESDIVGGKGGICKWIDLMFGCRLTDPLNSFHPYSYESSIEGEDPETIREIQAHARSFGIMPRQIFDEQHPCREPQQRGPWQERILF